MIDIAMNHTPKNDTARQNSRPRGHIPEPRLVLDPKMRARICSLLALGYSIRMAAEHIGCEPTEIIDAAKEDPRFRDQIADARSDADIDALKLLRRTASQEKNWRVAPPGFSNAAIPKNMAAASPNSFTGEQSYGKSLAARPRDRHAPAVPRAEFAEVMFEVEEELADVVAKARLPLPGYELPYEQESDEEGVPPQTASEAPTIVPPQASNPTDAAAASVADRKAPASTPTLNDSGKRVSCLQQFVQRVPKPAPAAISGNASRPTADATRCATLSAGKGQVAAAGARS